MQSTAPPVLHLKYSLNALTETLSQVSSKSSLLGLTFQGSNNDLSKTTYDVKAELSNGHLRCLIVDVGCERWPCWAWQKKFCSWSGWVNQIKPLIQGPLSCFQTSEELTGAEILSSTQEQPYHSIQRGEACSLTPQLASQQLRCLGRLTAYRLIADSVLTVQWIISYLGNWGLESWEKTSFQITVFHDMSKTCHSESRKQSP